MTRTFKGAAERGVRTYWHKNGQKSAEGVWYGDRPWGRGGDKDGVWTEWDESGAVTKTETYKNGELVQ
jgi:antitoxin component YwqK of YwqJK toxin-antitoxin module